MQQLTLDHNPPHQRHSRTSRKAAEAFVPKAPTKRALVLAYLKRCGRAGATDEEMQRGIPMGANTQRPRRVELCTDRLIVDSGRTRLTGGGDEAVVWVVNEPANIQGDA
ncbi:hypothetical protein H4CHR_04416 [Variovorax sp. PBS-H4]|uniref:hypothetical protein n=1 Tax=Variovorax sp. PBS-H4 TaxID=434008 RepID=UPI00131603B5|nr:hypothetical protein [Variovorax sp. PBS-H4]VTU38403.1 hypothetical protein H4CHR_04416 [Variovorax sp. PBS-H4]